jgi:hypothetical protein
VVRLRSASVPGCVSAVPAMLRYVPTRGEARKSNAESAL